MRKLFIGLVALCSISGCVWLFWIIQEATPDNGEKLGMLFALGLTVIPLIATIFIDHFIPPPKDEDYVPLNRPYLEPLLKVNRIADGKVNYSYKIFNRGKLPLTNIQFIFKSPGVCRADLDRATPLELSPHSSLSIDPTFHIDMPIAFSPAVTFELVVGYQGSIQGEVSDFKSIFRWVFTEDKLATGDHTYESCKHEDGKIDPANVPQYLGLDTLFKESQGTYLFGLRRDTLRVDSPTIFVSNEHGAIWHDPVANVVVVERISTDQNAIICLKQPLPVADGPIDIILVTWTPTEFSLMTDGVTTLRMSKVSNEWKQE